MKERTMQTQNQCNRREMIKTIGLGVGAACLGTPAAHGAPTRRLKVGKNDLVATLNEVSKALTDLGLAAALHQHTGTCVDSRDEVYAVFDAVDTRVVKFGPDVGQLQKSGTDPVPVLKDFQSLLRNI